MLSSWLGTDRFGGKSQRRDAIRLIASRHDDDDDDGIPRLYSTYSLTESRAPVQFVSKINTSGSVEESVSLHGWTLKQSASG